MKNHLLSLSDTVALIAAGHPLSIAGPEALLAQLPRGTWIGGTTVYALTENGGAEMKHRCENAKRVSGDGEHGRLDLLVAQMRREQADDMPRLAAGHQQQAGVARQAQ